MASEVALHCRCGELRAAADGLSPQSGQRMVCYCDDCQAYAHFMGQADMRDAWGGTDVYQMPQWRMRITAAAFASKRIRVNSPPIGLRRFADV